MGSSGEVSQSDVESCVVRVESLIGNVERMGEMLQEDQYQDLVSGLRSLLLSIEAWPSVIPHLILVVNPYPFAERRGLVDHRLLTFPNNNFNFLYITALQVPISVLYLEFPIEQYNVA